MTNGADELVGKRYDGGAWIIAPDEFRAYAAATDDNNPVYSGEDAVAPPMFHVRPAIGLMMQMASDPDLEIDLRFLVHGEHSMQFHRPLSGGDKLELSGTLRGVEHKASGRVFTFSITGHVEQQPALQGTTTYFVRNPPDPDAPKGPRRAPPPSPPPAHWQHTQVVSDDQALRYAEASGDRNPIHTDPDAAKAAGLPGCILHGLCTLALAARDLVDRYSDGDPRALLSLSVRWARPVFPGSSLALEVWDHGDGRLAFRTLGPDGKPVLVNGEARVAAPQ